VASSDNIPANLSFPDLDAFHMQAKRLRNHLRLTPVQAWESPTKDRLLGEDCHPVLKLELFQKAGSFKARGALTVVSRMSDTEKARGIVAGTGGNHGVAVALAAKTYGVDAKIIVPKTINSMRLRAIKDLDAEVMQVESIADVLDMMVKVAKDEGRTIVHPFEGENITLGTGTLGAEFAEQVPDLDAVIVPIGGGGLASGVACAIKQAKPSCMVYGVEPTGANSMTLAFETGTTGVLPGGPKSIADSLSAPYSAPYSYAVCRKFINEIVLIEDDAMRQAMKILFEDLKLAVEPAGAASTAALIGPLKEKCAGKKVGLIVCGANIGTESFFELIKDI